MSLERPREFRQTRKTHFQRYIGEPLVWRTFHQLGSSLEPGASHKAIHSFTRDSVKNSVKVKGREMTYSREFVQRKIAVQMLPDVVKNSVNTLFIIATIHHNLGSPFTCITRDLSCLALPCSQVYEL